MLWGERTTKVVWFISIVAQVLNWAGVTEIDFITVWSCSTPIEKAFTFLIPDRYGEIAMRWWDRVENVILMVCKATWRHMKNFAETISKCWKRDDDPLLPISV